MLKSILSYIKCLFYSPENKEKVTFGNVRYKRNGDALVGCLPIQFAGGTVKERYVEVKDDILIYKALKSFIHGTAKVDGVRIQAGYSPKKATQIDQQVYFKLPKSMEVIEHYPDRFSFLNLWELWNDPVWGDYKYPFRINLSLRKPEEGYSKLYWLVSAQLWARNSYEQVWRFTSSTPFEFNKWNKLNIHFKEGNKDTGKFVFKENDKIIFNVSDFTHSPKGVTKGVTHFNPMKLYTFKELVDYTPLEAHWKDLKVVTKA